MQYNQGVCIFKISPIKTPIVTSDTAFSLESFVDMAVPKLSEKSVLVVTSKIVSLLEGRRVYIAEGNKETLIAEEAQYTFPASESKYGYHFTITNHSIVASAGIDESNTGGYYVLWPENAIASANKLRAYLRRKHHLSSLGVMIVDSTSVPMRLGTVGMFLGYSGFKALRDYTGQPDLFGRDFRYSRLGVANGLAASAVFCMGEASEQTPICIIEDIPHIEFVDADPDETELACMKIELEDDLYAPFFASVPWIASPKE